VRFQPQVYSIEIIFSLLMVYSITGLIWICVSITDSLSN